MAIISAVGILFGLTACSGATASGFAVLYRRGGRSAKPFAAELAERNLLRSERLSRKIFSDYIDPDSMIPRRRFPAKETRKSLPSGIT
jgi:hypothetical protein